jgi:DNA-binding NtrC family response regulator
MPLRDRLETLIEEMLEGNILLAEACEEFEKLYVEKALIRYNNHLSKTAQALGIHRNTLSKKVSTLQPPQNTQKRLISRRKK